MPRRIAIWDPAALGPSAGARLDAWLAAPGPWDALQLRLRAEPADLRWLRARMDRLRTRGLGLHVNRDLALAAALAADAVQVGADADPLALEAWCRTGGRLGVSVHAPEEVRAWRGHADWFLFGHVRETPSKPGLPARGWVQLQATVEAASPTPVLGVGGLGLADEAAIRAAGAWGLAAIRAPFVA